MKSSLVHTLPAQLQQSSGLILLLPEELLGNAAWVTGSAVAGVPSLLHGSLNTYYIT